MDINGNNKFLLDLFHRTGTELASHVIALYPNLSHVNKKNCLFCRFFISNDLKIISTRR